jgi:uncharacterized damage-inducible protein DinB
MTTPILADAFRHHVWASLRLLDACAALDPAQLDATVPGTYGSILDTARHLVGADANYLWLLSDGRVDPVDEATMSIADLRATMAAHGPIWDAVVGADLDAERVLVRHRDDGSSFSAPLGIRLAQVVHHGTDHRSQICTALTTLGITPPEIDVWDYAWSEQRVTETPPTSPG